MQNGKYFGKRQNQMNKKATAIFLTGYRHVENDGITLILLLASFL